MVFYVVVGCQLPLYGILCCCGLPVAFIWYFVLLWAASYLYMVFYVVMGVTAASIWYFMLVWGCQLRLYGILRCCGGASCLYKVFYVVVGCQLPL
jgi:hypothetical protein